MKKMYENPYNLRTYASGLTKLFLLLVFFALGQMNLSAQCTTAPNGQYPGTTITAPGGAVCPGPAPTINIGTDLWASEYSLVSFQAQTYTVTSSVATDYITVTNSTGTTVVAHGVQPLSVVIPSATNYRVYRHKDGACTTEDLNRTISLNCTTCPAPAATVATTQPSTASVTGGAADVQIARLAVSNLCGTLTSLNLSTATTTNPADIIRAKVFYTTTTTFSTAVAFGTAVTSPSGAFVVTGSQALSTTGINYFWVVYDVLCAAPSAAGNVLDASIDTYTVGGVATAPATPNPTGTRTITALTSSAVTTQPTMAAVNVGSINNQMLRTQITTCAGSTVTALNLATTGSTSAVTDIAAARVYFTTTTTFSTTTQFGSTITSPNGAFVVTGSQVLASGTGYFWVVYDISATATGGNVVDAECTSVTAGAVLTPATTNPTGTRTILAAPANDNCATATLISSFPYSFNQADGAGASQTAFVLTCGTGMNDGVWYKFTGTGCEVTVTVTPTGWDPELGVFSGSCGTFTCVGFADNGTSGGAETVTFIAAAGVEYFINVGNWSGSTNNPEGPFTITATAVCCVAPTGVSAGNVGASSADITFAGTGTFVLEYGLTGFTPGTGATAGTGGTIISPAVSIQNIAGLTNSTGYSVYVRKDCGVDGFSANSTVANFTTLAPQLISAASGSWDAPATWVGGIVPTCTDNVTISAGHTVTVNSGANVSQNVTVQTTGSLVVASGDLSVGCTAKNNSLTINGTLSVPSGVLRVNGNILANTGSTFNQSGGEIIVDGNDAGAAATSVAAGIPIVSIQSTSLSSVNFTGGIFTIVDPHASSTSTETVLVNGTVIGPLNSTANHTFRFGDGVSTDPGGSSTFGFRGNWWVNESGLPIGNMIIEGPSGTNRFVSSTYQLVVLKNITANNGGELRTGNVYMGGNLIANAGGTISTTNTSTIATILLANVSYSTTVSGNLDITDATDAQTIGGAGTFRNAATAPTASTRNFSVQNASAAGVTLLSPLSVGFNFSIIKGIVNTSATNLLTVGTAGASNGTISRTDGHVNGPLKKWYAAATGTATLPIGTATLYKPATINFTTAPTTAGTITANFSSVAPSFPNATPLTEGALIINRASNQGSWFVEAGDGLAGGNYTASFTGNGAGDVLDYTKTVLIKRPTAGGDWTLDGVHVTSTGSNTAPVVSRTGMNSFSEFAIGGELLVALPITIEYFRGTKQNSKNVLDWKVSCYNSPSVTLSLERSADGRNYKEISRNTETAARCLQPFNHNDVSPLAGVNYYRLKSIDVDGKVTYSNVVALLNKAKGFEIVSLAPNPVQDKAVLSVTSAERTIMEIIISDVNGKQISKQRVSLLAGDNQVPLQLGKAAAGTYQVTGLIADGETKTLRFVKQ